jgi:hypothetical protein
VQIFRRELPTTEILRFCKIWLKRSLPRLTAAASSTDGGLFRAASLDTILVGDSISLLSYSTSFGCCDSRFRSGYFQSHIVFYSISSTISAGSPSLVSMILSMSSTVRGTSSNITNPSPSILYDFSTTLGSSGGGSSTFDSFFPSFLPYSN